MHKVLLFVFYGKFVNLLLSCFLYFTNRTNWLLFFAKDFYDTCVYLSVVLALAKPDLSTMMINFFLVQRALARCTIHCVHLNPLGNAPINRTTLGCHRGVPRPHCSAGLESMPMSHPVGLMTKRYSNLQVRRMSHRSGSSRWAKP